jgi:DNA polymerase III epsilon subunit-like protein
MNILFVDTETTGLPLWKEPSDHPGQPHIVDLAVELCREDGSSLLSYDAVINPSIAIPEDVASLHGITTEVALRDGISLNAGWSAFRDMFDEADLIVGHNISFDIRMLRILSARATGEKWSNTLPTFCTMRMSTNHCKLEPATKRHAEHYKNPRLGEAYEHFFGEPLIDGHRARPDVEACRRIYFHLKGMTQ